MQKWPFVAPHLNLAAFLLLQNQFDAVLQAYREALRITAGNMDAILGEANVDEKGANTLRPNEALRP